MDASGRHKLIEAINGHFRTYFESAQERFPAALVLLSRGEDIGSLREISGIKPDLLAAIRNIKRPDVAELFEAENNQESEYAHERLHRRHLLYRDVPDRLLVKRENLRRTGYVIMGHAQEARRHERHGVQGYIARALLGDVMLHRSSSYMSHMAHVFENAKLISEMQAHTLGLETPYDANLEEFTPGTSCAEFEAILSFLLQHAVATRQTVLEKQSTEEPPRKLPAFSFEQGQKLVDLICDLLPVPSEAYQTHLLNKIPSMCMGNIATIKFSPDPLILAEATFHEYIGHMVYRYNSDDAGGINGFHLDEARALSAERFLLREEGVLVILSELMIQAYGQKHPAFAAENLFKLTRWVRTDLTERVSADDLTYIIQEAIRGRTEMLAINGHLETDDIPDYMAAETEKAFGLEGLNGYHIMRETFQWPLCMHGHLSSYPQGFVMAANLHAAAKSKLGANISCVTEGHASPYFKFMAEHVDANGAEKNASDIMQQATGTTSFDLQALHEYFDKKKH